jgi:hypothetical protein
MDSKDWAQYLEVINGIAKSWLLVWWRLQLLQEQHPTLNVLGDLGAYTAQMVKPHRALMVLSTSWQGQKDVVFGAEAASSGDV